MPPHHPDGGTRHPSRTQLPPLEIAHDADALFYLDLAVPSAWHLLVDALDGSDEATWWLLADDRRSWAAAECVPGQTEYAIDQYGPRRL
ncbi:hypothetical protein LRS74_00545 [Streptomyces sp. LX-29]|uniref:hypothetical protein n=1 Tax=Streptomyces sp. LX-29 TaxID=2900152 RepID=UPI00240E8BD5|nr:hypothetical protein [Streptomyces sp. LX-29]WFB05668.1 hypothetical protein LRS74_00545 [Streptomyces sp. LX-29]